MREQTMEYLGSALAVCGSVLSIVGTLANNLLLDHTLAMFFWMVSNPILLLWAVGTMEFDVGIPVPYTLDGGKTRIWIPLYSKQAWWDGGLSIAAVAIMYLVFTITNFYGLFILGG